jgi:hypothetical protein
LYMASERKVPVPGKKRAIRIVSPPKDLDNLCDKRNNRR